MKISSTFNSGDSTSNSEKSTNVPEKSKFALTRLEIVFNRIFAVLLVLATVPLFLNILTIPTITLNIFTIPTGILFVLFSILLYFSKKYHPFINAIFLIFALGVYLIPLPIGWGLFLSLREFKFNGYVFQPFIIFFYLSPFIFISLSVRNVLGNILSCFKPNLRWRNLLFLISLITVMTVILAYPLLSSYKLRHRAMENTTGNSVLSLAITKQELKIEPGKSGAGSSALARRCYTASFDPVNNKYVYRLYLKDPLSESITFTAVETDSNKINFITDNRVKCLNCQKDINNPFGLIFPAGKDIDFVITSDQFIKVIKFTETENIVAEFVFWK